MGSERIVFNSTLPVQYNYYSTIPCLDVELQVLYKRKYRYKYKYRYLATVHSTTVLVQVRVLVLVVYYSTTVGNWLVQVQVQVHGLVVSTP